MTTATLGGGGDHLGDPLAQHGFVLGGRHQSRGVEEGRQRALAGTALDDPRR
jgi:hypothetical protein